MQNTLDKTRSANTATEADGYKYTYVTGPYKSWTCGADGDLVELWHCDSPKGIHYVISVHCHKLQPLSCTCPAFMTRTTPKQPCKHMVALRAIFVQKYLSPSVTEDIHLPKIKSIRCHEFDAVNQVYKDHPDYSLHSLVPYVTQNGVSFIVNLELI